MINSEFPHTAVVYIRGEIQEKTKNGELTNIPKKTLRRVVSVSGNTFDECEENLVKLLDSIEKGETNGRVQD